MRIRDLLSEASVSLSSSVDTKEETIDKLIKLMEKNENIDDVDEYRRVVLAREEEGSTGIGEGIAIPHGKSSAVSKPGLAAMVVKSGVDFDSLDGEVAKLFFLIAAPDTKDNVHLDVLSRLSTMLMDSDFKNSLINAKNKEEFLNLIDEAEADKKEAEVKKVEENKNAKYDILAITACPTGIAHTFMAAEAIEKKGEEMGIKIKVETHGQAGVANKFTKEEIKNCKGIIIAADTSVELDRFEGKALVKCKVADGIHKPEKLINDILNGNASVYHSSKDEKGEEDDEVEETFGRQIYKHLMSGVTHMLPFVVGGGILIALAFLFDNYAIDPSNFGMNTPLAAFFKTVGGAAFGVMLYILSGYIAYSIADRPGLAVGLVGGILAGNGTTFASLTDSSVALVSSGFLGALIAGFVGGYLVLGLKKLCSLLPSSLEGIKSILIYPVFGIFFMGIFMLVINPYVASINTAINDYLASMQTVNKVILGLVLGGMMAVDLGGPVNKAAYTFGTGMLASGQYEIMAAVMAGGMVPPLAIALLATIFPKKVAKKDKQAAFVNYIMGLSFISEGAIPFASADPLRTIPSFIVGSAFAGALSMAFSCTLMAPHGGVFVIATVGHPILYIISILAGSLVGAFMMAILKSDVKETKKGKK